MQTTQLREFLSTVVTTKQGFFELGVRNGVYKQEWYEWPKDKDIICEHALTSEGDVYFSAHLFSTKDSHKENVLPSRTIQQDLDNADIGTIPLSPSILVSTSPSRHQGFWIASTEFDSLQTQESLSKKLAYAIPLCDRSGWPLGHKVRVPFTSNYKYNTGPYSVELIRSTTRQYSIDELEILPDIPHINIPYELEFIERTPTPLSIGAYQLIEQVKDHLSAKVYAEYQQDAASSDRSAALFSLMCQCFRAGLSRDEVYWIAYHSPNNKFHADLRYNADRELAKDVIRAEHTIKNLQTNIRDVINDIRRKTKVLLNERRQQIYNLVLTAMQADGEFAHLVDGRRFYIPKDIGRPIEIEGMSESLSSLLDIKYSLNRTEIEHNYVRGALISYTGQLPEVNQAAVLSFYDPKSKHVLLHGGRKDIHVITANSITQTSQPLYNVVFPWDRIIEPITPDLSSNLDWGSLLFTIPNVINMKPEEARVVLKVYVLFSLLREAASSRPILAMLGQPGSGKTTIVRKLYAFFYGKHMDVSGATSPVNYDIATASLPFYCLDNLDTWEKWIPDRLAQSAGKTDVVVRKLYTNNQIIRIKRQAMVAVTAHDPKFGRADVTDRMLIISLQRIKDFQDEGSIFDSVIDNRNKLWGAVINDLQRVLATPFPTHTDLQLRIQDFARLGEWISIGLGEQDIFREAVSSLQAAQRAFNLEEDHILISNLTRWLAKSKNKPGPKTQDELYAEVMSIVPAEDIKTFQLLYKNSSAFSKRISNLQDTLNNTLFKVSITLGKGGTRLWLIGPKEEES